jgi:hypothetical protein
MADNSNPTPPIPAPAENNGAPGTGTGAGQPAILDVNGIPTDPVARAEHFEKSWKEATAQLTPVQQRNAKYRELYGDLEGEAPPTPQPKTPQAGEPAYVTREEIQEMKLDEQIGKTPSLVPHAAEVKNLMKGGATMDEAREVVAKRHNITLGPSAPNDHMPNMPSGGGAPNNGSSMFSADDQARMAQEGIAPELAKKHEGKLAEIWGKTRK